jgi:hypothetical protein
MPCPHHPLWRHHSVYISSTAQVRSSSLCYFLEPHTISSLFGYGFGVITQKIVLFTTTAVRTSKHNKQYSSQSVQRCNEWLNLASPLFASSLFRTSTISAVLRVHSTSISHFLESLKFCDKHKVAYPGFYLSKIFQSEDHDCCRFTNWMLFS